MNKAANAETERLLGKIDAGPGRWWKVELMKNVSTKPIKVTLMESQVEGRIALSLPIGNLRTVAVPAEIAKAADMILAMVGDYQKVVGEYGVTEEWAKAQAKLNIKITEAAVYPVSETTKAAVR